MPEINLSLYDDREWNFPYGYDFELPKPLKAREIARLGDELDEVESLPTWRSERCEAEIDYSLALRDRVWFEAFKLDNVKRVPSHRDGRRLYLEYVEALARWDDLLGAVLKANRDRRLPAGSTMRERLDARAALALANARFGIAQRKFRDAKKKAEADERAGKNFVTLRGMKFRRRKGPQS